jgi:hypothetical protein
LSRLGIRGFNPKLKKAAGRLEDLRTPEDEIPPNTMAELRRDMDRRRLVSDQIRQIEEARLDRLKQAPDDGPHAMLRLLARVIGVGIETADMLAQEVLARNMRDRRAIARYAGLTGSPDELRALAVTSAKRQEILPDAPALNEFYPGYEANGWYGIGAPKATPTEIIEKLNKEINGALSDPTIKGRLTDLGCNVFAGSPTDFGKFIADETEKWAKLIKFAGIKPE